MTGRTISHFEVLERLGEGGMGIVYKARDTRLDRHIALKVLPPNKVADLERKRRFVQEAKAASALNHPNIVTIHDIDHADGVDFIAMELVQGRTLDKLIPSKGMRLNDALKYAIQIADALAAAHAAGIVHRDLKPGNLMVTDNGQVKVLDFGLAKLTEKGGITEFDRTETIGDRPETEAGVIVGTASYMSPEQAEGKKVDTRSDIFSYGSVLYEMFTGQRAFQGETPMSTLAAILNKDPRPAGEIAAGLPGEADRIVTRCLRKDPARRFQTMADLKVALEEVKEESDSGRQSPTVATPARRLWGLVAAASALLLAGAGLAWFLLRPGSRNDAAMKVVPLTSYPGNEHDPTFSPDGTQVAFSWNGEKQDNYDIYVKLVAGGPPLRLTTDPARDLVPAWAPDGSRIAFIRVGRPGGIYLISPLGGEERKLSDLNGTRYASLSWSPDGKWLAFSELDSASPGRPTGAVKLISVARGEKKTLVTPLPESAAGDLYPVFSPDSRYLAFKRCSTNTACSLFVLPMDPSGAPAGNLRQLTRNDNNVPGVAWTPDGREILFSSQRPGGSGVWRIPAQAPLGTEPTRVAAIEDAPQTIAISRAARNALPRLAYDRSVSDTNIWRAPGSEPIPGDSKVQIIGSTRNDNAPQYSPDGKKIAFTSNRTGNNEIWVCQSDGSRPTQLTSLGAALAFPVWSPDGKSIAFNSVVTGKREIYVVQADGGTPPRQLTRESADVLNPSWSADGKWIYFMSNRLGAPQIWKLPAGASSDSSGAVQVTRNGGYDSFESPNGGTLYYTKVPPGGGLWRMPATGGAETAVLPSVIGQSWALAEKGIYFVDKRVLDPPYDVNFYRFDTQRVSRLMVIDKPMTRASRPSASSDGRWILWSQLDHEGSDLILIENFR